MNSHIKTTKKGHISLLIWSIFLFLFSYTFASASTYYVSNTGSDSNNGTSTSTPWQTLAKVNASTFIPGDSILFKKGDTFYGSITVSQSGTSGNPITFSSYGTGNQPIITGFTDVTSWTNLGNNIWESTNTVSTLDTVNMVTVNGTNTAMGRYPNADTTNGGYLTVNSHSGLNSLTSSGLSGNPNWTGAETVVRTSDYTLDRSTPITSQTGGTINFTLPSYSPADGFGFFIQNDPRTLDQQNEWYYNKTNHKIQMYSASQPTGVKVASVTNLLTISSDYIDINGIDFIGSNGAGVYNQTAGIDHINILNNNILFSGIYGMRVKLNNSSIENNTVQYSNNTGISVANSTYMTISSNIIRNSGVILGMGNSGIGSSYGIDAYNSPYSLIDYNKIINTGYIGISFYGNSIIVSNNFVDTFCSVLQDGGGIYTSVGGDSVTTGDVINDNIVVSGIGAILGTTSSEQAHGIYLDDNTKNFEVYNNISANNKGRGIFLHNSSYINLHDNTTYNNFGELLLNNLGTTLANSGNNLINNNRFVSASSWMGVVEYDYTFDNWTAIGTFNNNYYARPLSNNTIVRIKTPTISWVDYTLPNWTILSGQDTNSKKSPVAVSSESDIFFDYNATTSNKTSTLPWPAVDMDGVKHTGNVTILPYSSVIYLKDPNPASSDTTAPTISSFTIPTTSSSLTVPISTLSATDATGVTGYLLTETSATPSAASGSWSSTVPTSYVFSTEGSKTLYAWAKDAAGNVSTSVSDTVTITLAARTTPTTFYISNTGSDSNNGTSTSTPWQTLAKVNASTFIPGDSILFKKGDTWTNETIIIPSSGSIDNLIKISSYGSGNKPILISSLNNPVIKVNSANRGYWNIDGLDIRSSGDVLGGQPIAIYFDYWPDSDIGIVPGWVIQNCDFKDQILVSGPNIIIKNNIWNGIGDINARGGAIAVRGANGTNAIIEGNTISNFIDRGIWIYRGANSPIIRNNIVYNITPGVDNDGMGINIDGYSIPIYDAKVYGNHVYDCGGVGISNENGYNAEYYNNLIERCGWAGLDIIFYGSNRSNASNINYHNNVIINCNWGFVTWDANTYTLANNIFYNGTGDKIGYYIASDSSYVSGITYVNNIISGVWTHPLSVPDTKNIWAKFDNNIISPNGSEIISRGGVVLTLTQLRALGLMTNGFISNPLFIDSTNGNFHLQSTSPAINAGTDVGLTTDYEGNSIVGLPDIGAYESNYTSDTTAPSISSFTIPTTSSSLTVPISTFTATDTVGVTGYLLTESSTTPSAASGSWSSTVPTSYVFSTEGSKTLYAWAKDAASNVSTSVSDTVTITLPPVTATTFTLTGPSSGNINTASTSFTITPNNTYTGTITITPSGTASTGLSAITKTFSSSSVAQTFTITPTVAGSITLSPSNNGGLTNPANLTYTSNAVVPGAPTSVSAVAGNASATVSFLAPSSNGGSTITGYTVTSSPAGGTDTNAGSTSLSHSITGLTNGTSYTFTVKATNAIGQSVASAASSAVTPQTNTFTLTINKSGTGSGTVTGGGTYNSGTSVTAGATPSTGSTFTSWSGDCNTSGQVTMTANKVCTATFTLNTYSIVSSTGTNGNISPLGTTSKNYATNQTYTITPSTGYHIVSVLVDGVSQGAISTYTFTNVTANHTISATFDIDVINGTISNVSATATSTSSITANWTTSVSSDSQVEYGLTTSYGSTTSVNTNLTTSHSISIPNLKRNTTYHYRVKSVDATSNILQSTDQIIKTLSQLTKTPKVRTLTASNGSVNLSWLAPLDPDGNTYELYSGVIIMRSTTSFIQSVDTAMAIADIKSPTMTYHDTDVVNGTTYYYTFFAYDNLGVYSDPEFISFTPTQAVSSGGGGGGGGGSSSSSTTTTTTSTLSAKAKAKDIKQDGSINIFDFNIIMANWNQTYSTTTSLSKGDMTGDGIINIFDINQLMIYWGVGY